MILIILLLIIIILINLSLSLSFKYNKFRVSFVLGAPASGKSTQCSKLVEEFGCVHLSAGDLLRKERESGSEVAELIESYITQGAIVPVELTLRLIKTAMESSLSKRFLIDGFPRNQDNLQGWIKEMSECSIVDSIIFLDCPELVCEERILKRVKLSGRSDDNIATLKKRFTIFKDITMPVVKYFENIIPNESLWLNKNGINVYKIDGDREEEIVYKNVKHGYQEMIKSELIELSQSLIDSIDNNNEEIYYKLVESKQNCDNFKSNIISRKMSTLSNINVRIMGKSAIVSYIRLLQEDNNGNILTKSYEESRIWELIHGKNWKNIYTHSNQLV